MQRPFNNISTGIAALSGSSASCKAFVGNYFASKLIAAQVRRAGLTDIIGSNGRMNVQGEIQQKLDVYADETLIKCLSDRASVGVLASEENEHPILLSTAPEAHYAIIFDPLDGSSNIDVAVTIGTTFSIFPRPENADVNDPLTGSAARKQADRPPGYIVYGSLRPCSCYSLGSGVHGFYARSFDRHLRDDARNIRCPRRALLFVQRSV